MEPRRGGGGSALVVTGVGFCSGIGSGPYAASASCAAAVGWPVVTLGDAACRVTAVTDTRIDCVANPRAPAVVPVKVLIPGLGFASGAAFTFEYLITLNAVAPTAIVSVGGANVTLSGIGFGFLAAAAQARAEAAVVTATALVGFNAKKVAAVLGSNAFTMTTPQVQLHGIGADIQYLGCFDDDGSMLPHHMPGDHYNVAKCLAVCMNLTYTYAGLTRGSRCRCGDSYGPSAGSAHKLVSAGEEVIASNGEVTQCRLGCAGARDVVRSRVATVANSVLCAPNMLTNRHACLPPALISLSLSPPSLSLSLMRINTVQRTLQGLVVWRI